MTARTHAVYSHKTADVVLIGGGIMSATLGSIILQLEPGWDICLYERLDRAGMEASDSWNNAGTGHSALCELNYSPASADGSVEPTKAIKINEQFQVSRQFWSHMVVAGHIGAPRKFINPIPHMSFVWGDGPADYLRRRYEALKPQPLFETMEHTEDHATLSEWAPLVMGGRDPKQRVAASRVEGGTDIDFGSLTRELTEFMEKNDVDLNFGMEVTNVVRGSDGRWEVSVKDRATGEEATVRARFVFIGAGGGALHLLQRTGIPEGKGFGGFPVGGQFLRCGNEEVVDQHNAKVYGQASVGAPPMSVPHLDTRFVNGKRSLLFGPYAGFSTKFLKRGSLLDLPLSLRPSNLIPMLAVGKDNMDLAKYLITEVLKSRESKNEGLREYYPQADGHAWELITAGQRVQVIKKHPTKGGILQFGTEMITSSDGSIGALLGASPGASTAAPIMFEMLERCFPQQATAWQQKIKEMIPGYGVKLNENPQLAREILSETAKTLQL
ncbi:malate:quinone oxidoreductase [Citricoccus nitrophenolicus]|nr:malate:quinone oxidoreductase [Arthrobacter pigmenti]